MTVSSKGIEAAYLLGIECLVSASVKVESLKMTSKMRLISIS
jgi:hypothetical protein